MGKTHKNVIMVEEKNFQDEPNIDLADEIYELSKRARTVYGERMLSDFLATQSMLYRTGVFQHTMETFDEISKQKVMNSIDFSKENIQ